MKTPSLIIFDCDGTMVDSESISNQLISDMMNEIGIAMTLDRSLELFEGKSFIDIKNYIDHHLKSAIDFDFESEFRIRCKAAFEKDLKANPGVTTFIESLTIPYCLASNGPRIKMETTLRVTGLNKYFTDDIIFSAYDIKAWKPKPDLFLYASDKMGASAENTIVFEDTLSGIEAADKADMKCIVYEPDPSKNNFIAKGYHCIQSFENLKIEDLIN